jgi:hypothetical protein
MTQIEPSLPGGLGCIAHAGAGFDIATHSVDPFNGNPALGSNIDLDGAISRNDRSRRASLL